MAQRVVLELVIDEPSEDTVGFEMLTAAIMKTVADHGFKVAADILMPFDPGTDNERYGLED